MPSGSTQAARRSRTDESDVFVCMVQRYNFYSNPVSCCQDFSVSPCPLRPGCHGKKRVRQIFVKEHKDLPSYWTKGIHEPLIDEETFFKVQDILDGKKRNAPKLTGTKRIHPDLFLRKFLICPKCGHALTGAGSKGNGGRYYYYFCCHDHKHLNMRAENMNDMFVKYVGTLKPNETVLQLYEQILADIRDEGNKDKKAEVERLKKDLAEQEKLVESVEDKYVTIQATPYGIAPLSRIAV